MKSFNFKSATNTKEAAKMATGRATFLAGGMTLIPAMKLRLAAYSDLINIKKIKTLCKKNNKSLSIEVTTNDKTKILEEALSLKKKFNFKRLHIKIPVSQDNLSLIKSIHKNKMKVNVTCVYTLAQGYFPKLCQ